MFIKKPLSHNIAAVSAAVFLTPLSYAQGDFALEEVLVTAQKRAESVQDVPIAISAVSEDILLKTGVNNVTALIPMIPGLTGSSLGVGTNTWAIRGISTNDWTIGSEPSVGVFFDDAYIGRSPFATGSFFDISRVEVVKGPQGTLFGRNSSVGAISITSNKPSEETSFLLGGKFGNEGQQEYDVMANLAIGDNFSVRAAYSGYRLDGIWEDVVQGEDGFTDTDSYRLMALWSPSETFEALLTLSHSKLDSNMSGEYSPALSIVEPGEEFPDKLALSQKQREDNDTDGIYLRLIWELSDSMTLTSITDARSYDYSYTQDFDGTADDAAIDDLLGPITGGVTIEFQSGPVNQNSISQEFRLNGSLESLDWFVGASYFNENADSKANLNLIDTALGIGLLAQDQVLVDGKTESMGIYGDVTWTLNEAWAVTAGARWSQDEKDWCTQTSAALGILGVTTPGQLCDDEDWDKVTPRLVIDYTFNQDLMVFVSASTGYKGGGFNLAAIDTTGDFMGDTISAFDPETNTAYELGLKSTLLDGRLQFNGSVYYNDYDDLQVQTSTSGGIIITNEAAAETQGLELELSYMPLSNLVLTANYAYLDAEFTEGELDGNDLAYAPENTYSVSADYEMDISVGLVNMYVMYNWQDDFYFDAANIVPEDSYGTLNAKLTYTPPSENWDLSLAGDNLTDEEYAASRIDYGLGAGVQINRGMPRLLRVEFNLYL